MHLVALDPGKHNFAYAVLTDGKCKQHGHIRTVTDLHYNNVHDELVRFSHDITCVISRHTQWLAFERMQHRPHMGGGAVVEYINLMLGVCIEKALQRGAKLYPVAPVTWKSAIRKQAGIDKERFCMSLRKIPIRQPAGSKPKTRTELVEGVLAGQPGAAKLSPHEGDAVGVGCYVWKQLTGIDIVSQVLT
jgi:hypothetical protein